MALSRKAGTPLATAEGTCSCSENASEGMARHRRVMSVFHRQQTNLPPHSRRIRTFMVADYLWEDSAGHGVFLSKLEEYQDENSCDYSGRIVCAGDCGQRRRYPEASARVSAGAGRQDAGRQDSSR